MEYYDIKETLNSEFGATNGYVGSFAHKSTHHATPNPALAVRAFGPVGLPVDEPTAARLLARGRGYTVGDAAAVHNSIHISAKDVIVRNPHFVEWLVGGKGDAGGGGGGVLKTVCRDLGITDRSGISIHLWKLLVYETGGHFVAHRDSAKEPGMFATLAIDLPSKFEGGALVVEHRGKKKTFDFSGESAFSTNVAAWYADVLHTATPVTSGYRVVLTYNLIMHRSATVPSAERLGSISGSLSRALRSLHAQGRSIAYLLEHQYSLMSHNTLKGKDKYLLENLCSVAKHFSFDIYLADWEMHESTFDDLDADSDFDITINRYQHVAGPGTSKATITSSKWDEENVIPEDANHCISPYNEKMELAGNAGVEIDRWYRWACVVLVPVAPTARKRKRPVEEVTEID